MSVLLALRAPVACAEVLLVEGLRYAGDAGWESAFAYFLPWKDALMPALREQGADVSCFDCRSNVANLRSARRVADNA